MSMKKRDYTLRVKTAPRYWQMKLQWVNDQSWLWLDLFYTDDAWVTVIVILILIVIHHVQTSDNRATQKAREEARAVMDRSDQADTKQRKLHHLACAPLRPSPPYPSKLVADPMAQVEGIVCFYTTILMYSLCPPSTICLGVGQMVLVFRLPCAVIARLFRPLYYRVQ